MKIRFKQELFAKAVTEKMFEIMSNAQKKIGITELGRQIGISKATFSRVQRGKPPEIETFLRVCIWLDKSADEFCDKE